ncbi:MAG TPA: formate--tetrahydrofolate ligase [Kofleriaceae bacterium]
MAGFGFYLGGEKLRDLKCRASWLWPDALVLVATIRALTYQGSIPVKELALSNADAIDRRHTWHSVPVSAI